jgi:hypothetical protein
MTVKTGKTLAESWAAVTEGREAVHPLVLADWAGIPRWWLRKMGQALTHAQAVMDAGRSTLCRSPERGQR